MLLDSAYGVILCLFMSRLWLFLVEGVRWYTKVNAHTFINKWQLSNAQAINTMETLTAVTTLTYATKKSYLKHWLPFMVSTCGSAGERQVAGALLLRGLV